MDHYICEFGILLAFWDSSKYKNMDKITEILENVVRCKYFEAGVHIKNPIKNSYQDGLGRTTQTLDHVGMVHILIWDKRKSQINEYSDLDASPYWVMIRENRQFVTHEPTGGVWEITGLSWRLQENYQSF